MSTRVLSTLTTVCGILGVVILGVYYSGVLVPQLPAADPQPSAKFLKCGNKRVGDSDDDPWQGVPRPRVWLAD